MAVKPTEIVAVKVRMPEALRRVLASDAKRRGISLNREIVRLIREARTERITAMMFSVLADVAVDTAYARLGLGKPSDMIDLIEQKFGPDAAKAFAAGSIDAASRKGKANG
jgi:hypothetical protein